MWFSRSQIHWAASKVNSVSSRFVLQVSSIKSKITAEVWYFNTYALACKQLQTSACLKRLALKGGLAEDKEWCRVFGASQPGTGDTLRTPQWKKSDGNNNIDSNPVNSIWSRLSSQLRFSSPNCMCVCVCVCSSVYLGAVVLSVTQQFTYAAADNPLYIRLKGIELLYF